MAMTRIAIVQTDPRFGRSADNVAAALDQCAGTPADLYVLPELFATGYNFEDAAELAALAESASGPTMAAVTRFAAQRSCYLAYGFAERSSPGGAYNSAALVGPAGIVGLYRKVHLYANETVLFSPGDMGFPVYELPFGRVGIMICFDWIFPESARSLALGGAELIAHPSNLVLRYCPDAMVTRCLENRVYAATANRIGREDRGGIDLRFTGQSQVVSPQGEVLVRLGERDAGVRAVEVDLAAARQKRINAQNDILKGRRPDQYRNT